MATHKSSEKRARQDIKKSANNQKTLSSVRTAEKKLRTAIASKDAKTAAELLKKFSSTIDKASSKGVIPAKTASRKISRVSTQISSLSSK
ncbi:MAG: 30S ribosomal protein S20 [Bdellovibrionota bacterium]